MSLIELKSSTEQKMQKSIDAFTNELAKIRTGRVHVGLLDQIQVDYYGSMQSLKQIANITMVDSRTLGVVPWEKKLLAVAEKAIRESGLGLNPMSQGEMIRVPMPALTEQRRKDLVKVIKGVGENARVAIRGLRRESNEQLKKMFKDKIISEDEERKVQDQIQKLTDRFITDIDKALTVKETELMAV